MFNGMIRKHTLTKCAFMRILEAIRKEPEKVFKEIMA